MKTLANNHAGILLQDSPNSSRTSQKKLIEEHGNILEQNHQPPHNQLLTKTDVSFFEKSGNILGTKKTFQHKNSRLLPNVTTPLCNTLDKKLTAYYLILTSYNFHHYY